jgi:hypothetical protein
MHRRTDNVTGWLPNSWMDPIDADLMNRAMPIILRRHGDCVPTRECLIDAFTRYCTVKDD